MNRVPSTLCTALKYPLSFAIATLFSVAALAENQALEEIIVTSQKRAQTLQEVPISVATVDGEKIDSMGVENLEDLSAFAPNIHFTETGLSTQMRIRGIGSDNSQGFEQSVGVYADGIYHSRAQLFRAPMFDIERVEIMRGPQGTLMGKNSIAGAIEIITAKPQAEREGKITYGYETEFGTQELSGFITGALNEELKARVAWRVYDDPGYMINTAKNDSKEAYQKEHALRVTLDWSPSAATDVLFTAERDTFDVQGRFAEVTQDLPSTAPDATSFGQSLANISPELAFDPEFNFQRQANAPEFSDNKINTQTLRIDHETDHFTITAITGHVEFNYSENCDCDFTPAPIFDLNLDEDYDQFSQEIRLVSEESDRFEWLAGVFYQSFEQTFHDLFRVPGDSYLPQIIRDGFELEAFPDSFKGTGIDRQFEQSSDTIALFAESTWHITDELRLTFGGRYTEETKEGEKELNVVDLSQNNAVLTDPTIAGIYLGLFNTETEQAYNPATGAKIGHQLKGKRKEHNFTPSVNLAYDLNDDVMTYAKVSRGFKAGGFDPRSNVKAYEFKESVGGVIETSTVSAFEFEEEEVLAMELGAKMRLLENRMEFNLALFRMDYDDLQISQFDGAVGFNVGNAKETIVQGFEVDGRWQISDAFTSAFGFSYLDFEYTDFKNGNCHYGQTADTTTDFCDFTGKRGVYTPEFTVNGTLAYHREINSQLTFQSSMDIQWIDEQQVHVNLDPLGEIDAYTMLALRFALVSENWQLALRGKNLLNEKIVTYSGNMPLSETVFQSNSFYSFVQRPRTVTLEATYHF